MSEWTGIWTECWNCGGEGRIAGCFEDTCVCGCDDDPDWCCSPSRCDICKGNGGYYIPVAARTDQEER